MSNRTKGEWKWMGTNQNPKGFCYLQNEEWEQVGASLSGFTTNPDNAKFIAMAGTVAHKLDSVGYNGEKCIEELETLVKCAEILAYSLDKQNFPETLEIVNLLLAKLKP